MGMSLMGVTTWTPFASCFHFPFQMIYHQWDKKQHCSFCCSQLFSGQDWQVDLPGSKQKL